jgi:hypothetical protein
MADREAWTVYRYYDAAGRLLYVGATGSGYYRAHGHARSGAAWWPLVARGEFEHFATMAEAYSAELRQIVQLSPLFNRADNPQWQGPRAVREPDAPIRPRVEQYLAQLGPDELARMTKGELADTMAAHGVDVSVRYAGQILDEYRVGLPMPARRGSGDDRRRGGR